MPRSNWRPPAGLPDYQSPVAVEDDQDDQQLPEAEPGDESLSPVERVIFRPNGQVVHLKWPGATAMFCGRFPMHGAYRSRVEAGPVCKRCRYYPAMIPAADDPASYEAADEYVRVRFPGDDDLAKVVHLRRIGQEDSRLVLCIRALPDGVPADPTSVDDGPLCQHCVWNSDEIKLQERYRASIRKTSSGSGRR